MKPKHIFILISIFGALILIGLMKSIFMKPEIEVSEYEDMKLLLNIANIRVVEMEKFGDAMPLRLEKKDGEWCIPSKWGAKAKTGKVESFLEMLTKLKGELRSGDKELLADYGITDEKSHKLAFYDQEGNLSARFYLGTEQAGYGKTFLRKDNSSLVYLIDGDIFVPIGVYGDPKSTVIDVLSWLDLSLIDFAPETIKEVKIKKQIESIDREITLEAEKIKSFLETIKSLSAMDIVDPKGEGYGFDKTYLTITLISQDSFFSLFIGNTAPGEEGRRYIETPKGVFIIPKSQLDSIENDLRF